MFNGIFIAKPPGPEPVPKIIHYRHHLKGLKGVIRLSSALKGLIVMEAEQHSHPGRKSRTEVTMGL